MACQGVTAVSDGNDDGMTQSRIARCGELGEGNVSDAEDMEFLGLEHSLHLRSHVDESFSFTIDSASRTGHYHVLQEQRVLPSESRLTAHKPWSEVTERELHSALHASRREYTQLKEEVSKALRRAKLTEAEKHTFRSAKDAALNGGFTGEGRSEDSLHTAVVKRLRRVGFDAALCHCRREQEDRNPNLRRDFPAEGYTYVDVILRKGWKPQMLAERIIVDVRFQDEFKIARPTAAYTRLLKALPTIYVGTTDTLRQIVKLMTVCRSLHRELYPS
ncbi:hypothetical protein KP509_13G087100 [Ceratopteris richardii]|uniref:Uncharacterized protein n=1 Tax=Ceratopteris richardii TaxID=49495 RepID=A0A8T2TFG2_CERRI|nr:hypothetical protein KP509_13G087100 [Ceratopteris richardii]